jgi:ADP-ribose pyrophosphatase YjhB (NUDIX family)
VLAEEGGVKDPEILAAAILHDTPERTPRPPVVSSSASSEPV